MLISAWGPVTDDVKMISQGIADRFTREIILGDLTC